MPLPAEAIEMMIARNMNTAVAMKNRGGRDAEAERNRIFCSGLYAALTSVEQTFFRERRPRLVQFLFVQVSDWR